MELGKRKLTVVFLNKREPTNMHVKWWGQKELNAARIDYRQVRRGIQHALKVNGVRDKWGQSTRDVQWVAGVQN